MKVLIASILPALLAVPCALLPACPQNSDKATTTTTTASATGGISKAGDAASKTVLQGSVQETDTGGLVRKTDESYGRSFYSGIYRPVGSGIVQGTSIVPNASDLNRGIGQSGAGTYGSFYRGVVPYQPCVPAAPSAGLGAGQLTGIRFGMSNYGVPYGIGAPASKTMNWITPFGNGANGPIGTYGGSSFGSAGGGAVR